MAGSLRHIVAIDGSFSCKNLDYFGDMAEALEECHQIIAFLLPFAGRGMPPKTDATGALAEALETLGYPKSATPILSKS